ncbi:MAG: hypothetical protein OXU64_09645 [Gemmatimonadota bacterium]|nr:hypothetical protein [Gemmatimonadota bacterium]
MIRALAVPAALVAFVACGDGGEAPAPGPGTFDSAGVSIVTSAPTDGVYADVAEEAALAVGAEEGPEELLFGRIASVARDERGNLVVADRAAGEIRIFGADGSHLRSFGGRGEGPGEFRALDGAWPTPGGGIVAADGRLDRISRFDAMGSPVGTAELSSPDRVALVTPLGLAGPETFLGQVRPLSMPSMDESPADALEEIMDEEHGPPVFFLRYAMDGRVLDTLARRPGQRRKLSTSGDGDTIMMQLIVVPFSPQPSAAGSDHGVAITGGTEYEISLFDASGQLSRIARLAEQPTLRTDEHLEAYVRSSGNPFMQDEASIRKMIANYREMPMPESLPAYTRLRIAETGELWARRYSLRGAPFHRWDVFGTEGRYLGRVEVPSSFRVEEVGRGRIAGIATDELGVQRAEVRDLIFTDR